MYRALVLLPLALGLGASDLTVDHVTVAGRSLASLRAGLTRAGIAAEYGGPHSNHATEMALTSFPDGSYLELIALQPDALPAAVAAHEWFKELRMDAGPCAWAARSQDLAADLDRLVKAGVEVGAPARNGRSRPDGVRLEWETARVGREPNGTFFPFLIQDFGARAPRAFSHGKPTTEDFNGIAKVVIAVRDLEAAAARYQKAFGASVTGQENDSVFGARLARVGSTPVVLAAPLEAGSWLSKRLTEFGEGPVAFVLDIRASASGRYRASTRSRWFGRDISWFDSAELGWHLGFE